MDLVTYNTAKLAKKCGFNLLVQNKYLKGGGLTLRYGQPIDYNNECFQDKGRMYTSAPTQSELQKWLREVYKFNIVIKPFGEEVINYLPEVYTNIFPDEVYDAYEEIFYSNYEQCLEDCLFQSLETLLKYEFVNTSLSTKKI